ncbi:hypothetical protein NKL07_22160 [Mesorhizobium sp. C280B]|uniref:hypothetical protein n=1 Tax=unclassified Mesorhizobium TaxID=325217 RepID=UPI0003CEE3ED|nr:hypothetical protein [Mesorhizobium sp. LSJC280B00]ESW92971.1 hypothetical protein X772_03265 [Mesorhizobium sp. LSJC280B00]
MSDAYRTVTALVRQVRENSIMVEVASRQGWQSIPRSLIHGADEIKLDRIDFSGHGQEHTFRLMEWKAEELGLA